MKKLVVLLIFSAVAAFGTARFNLGESGAQRFLTKMESLMSEGRADEVCDMFHDEFEAEIADHSGVATHNLRAGKQEFCELTRKTVAGLQQLPHSMEVEYTDLKATQKLSKPWTSDVTYSERRTLSILGSNASLRTVSEDEITLVQTFTGVKLRKVKSQVFKTEET